MAFTPLHRALGLQPSALTYAMLPSAIEQRVTEKGDLDWKEKLPDSRNPKANEEFAKDVAAMVNGGGGMIVYGVAEDRVSSAAERIVSVEDWSDTIERKLRGWAYSLIQPPVHGLEFTPLEESDKGPRVLVLEVPASLETPHFSMKDDALRAPRRYGAQTVFMSERDIEQAYRTRFEDRRNNARSLSDLLDQTMTGIDQDGVWLVAAARPLSPRPAHTARISRQDAREILDSLTNTNPFLKDRYGFEYADLNPRPGYRKWRSISGHGGIVDIHDDGSVSVGHKASIGRDGFEASTDIHVMDAQQLPAHIIHLARATTERMDMTSDYEVSMVLSAQGNNPIFIRTFETAINHLRSRDQLTAIHKFQPVTGILAANISEDEALVTVRSLALDVMNQGGSPALGRHYLRDQL
ncbi:AlbA family DNA-binding domain-containing protein [Pseudarthrobacter sp. N5]|uniref:AlbA family DNA-binding domain-containing protein n=1 Tax=Pseudarthrobacter sp. N5 TaxID=3418416 RepID=UPI003CFB62DF